MTLSMVSITETTDYGLTGDADTTPHSIPAEQALLGALLYDNEVYHRISGIVGDEHFYNPVHKRIFETAARLIESGKLADAIVLKNRFSQDETLVDIGGEQYLAELLLAAPSGATAIEYGLIAALISVGILHASNVRFTVAVEIPNILDRSLLV